jgi:hypothetical protein
LDSDFIWDCWDSDGYMQTNVWCGRLWGEEYSGEFRGIGQRGLEMEGRYLSTWSVGTGLISSWKEVVKEGGLSMILSVMQQDKKQS